MGISKRISNLINFLKSSWWIFRRTYFPTKKEKLSKGEAFITSLLKYSNCNFSPQYPVFIPELNNKTHTAFIDFLVTKDGKKYAIEFNGKQHYEYVPFFHKGGITDLFKQINRDKIIKKWCENKGITFIEIPYTYTVNEIVNELKKYFL